MLALRQTDDIETAALNHSRPRHCEVLEAAIALRNDAGSAARIERRQESVAERFHLGEGMRLATLVDHGNGGPLLYRQLVWFEVPARIRGTTLGPHEKITQACCVTKSCQRDVVAKASPAFPQHHVERCWIAFVQCHDLGDAGRISVSISISLRSGMGRAGQNHPSG